VDWLDNITTKLVPALVVFIYSHQSAFEEDIANSWTFYSSFSLMQALPIAYLPLRNLILLLTAVTVLRTEFSLF